MSPGGCLQGAGWSAAPRAHCQVLPLSPAVPWDALLPPAHTGRSFLLLSCRQACTAGTSGPILARGKGVRVEQAQGGRGHPSSDQPSAPYAASVLACGTFVSLEHAPQGVTLTLSPYQTPPGMSPSAGTYLQMAVSFNYRCLALFTDTGYIWMGLATLKVSLSLPSPGWSIRVSAHPSAPCLADRSSSVGCLHRFPGVPHGFRAAGRPRCCLQVSALRTSTLFCSSPDFRPDSPLFLFLDPPFCWHCVFLSLSELPPDKQPTTNYCFPAGCWSQYHFLGSPSLITTAGVVASA